MENQSNTRQESVNAQKWLDENYPKEKRSEMTEIYLNELGLIGELDLKDFMCQYLKIYVSSRCTDED